ncbi:hypothetical protein BgiBS90_013150 [Biomphalaria glabrata]|nr:hypothetical protein BgiBS90_013150 [Biomphalaria glabrata]
MMDCGNWQDGKRPRYKFEKWGDGAEKIEAVDLLDVIYFVGFNFTVRQSGRLFVGLRRNIASGYRLMGISVNGNLVCL